MRATSAAGASASVSSVATPTAVPPCCSIAAAVACARSAEREVTTTLMPRAASSVAMARPMPEEDPVTMATRPVSGWVLPSSMHPAA